MMRRRRRRGRMMLVSRYRSSVPVVSGFMCTLLLSVSASAPVDKCPRSLDCARERRHFCQPGSSHCGPCLDPLVEDKKGQCVDRKRQAQYYKASRFPDLDEEIDFLSSIIDKQQDPEPVTGAPQSATKSSKQKSSSLNSTTAQSTTSRPPPTIRSGPVSVPLSSRDSLLIIMISVCIGVGTLALVVATVCWIRLQRSLRLTQKVDYRGQSRSGRPPPTDRISPGDKNLAQSAQMYHYQHQKQQMLSMEKHKDDHRIPESGNTSDEETEEGDFTVYECPGLAPTGEMEVKNPLFDDSTVQPQRNRN